MKQIFGKADLHIHSKFSGDCFTSIQDILATAQKRKLDVIAITDHHTFQGFMEAEKIAPQFGVKLIKGEEIKTKQGDLIALFIDELIKPRRDILETIREVHQQGGLAIVPHPFSFWQRSVSFKTLIKIYQELDGLEVFNNSRWWLNPTSQRRLIGLNQQNLNLAEIGSSDAHIKDQIGLAYTAFQGNTPNDLYFSIKNRLTRSQKNNNFSTVFKTGLKLIPTQPLRILKYLFNHNEPSL